MPDQAWLSDRQRELIAVGASIAAGCRPCTAYHLKTAINAGAAPDEIRWAVDAALEARRSAAAHMAQLADRLLAGVPRSDQPIGPDSGFLKALISAGAALAVNCGVDLAAHVAHARDLGAADMHLRAAFEVTRMVKTMAGRRVEAAAARAVPESAAALVHEGN